MEFYSTLKMSKTYLFTFFVIMITTEALTSHGTNISSKQQQLDNIEAEESDDSLLVLEFDSND